MVTHNYTVLQITKLIKEQSKTPKNGLPQLLLSFIPATLSCIRTYLPIMLERRSAISVEKRQSNQVFRIKAECPAPVPGTNDDWPILELALWESRDFLFKFLFCILCMLHIQIHVY